MKAICQVEDDLWGAVEERSGGGVDRGGRWRRGRGEERGGLTVGGGEEEERSRFDCGGGGGTKVLARPPHQRPLVAVA